MNILGGTVSGSGEARGPAGSLGGAGSRYSHAHLGNRPQFEKATSRDLLSSWDPLPFPFPKTRRGDPRPGRKGGVPARRGVGVPARGVLQPVRGQEAYSHQPGPPTSRDPSHFPTGTNHWNWNQTRPCDHMKTAILCHLSLERVGCVPRTIVPGGGVSKSVYVSIFLKPRITGNPPPPKKPNPRKQTQPPGRQILLFENVNKSCLHVCVDLV